MLCGKRLLILTSTSSDTLFDMHDSKMNMEEYQTTEIDHNHGSHSRQSCNYIL